MRPSQRKAPTFFSALPSTPRRDYGVAAAPLCLLLAGVVAVAATSATAAPPRCPPDRAIYEGANDSNFEIEFFRDFTTKTRLAKTGVMRIHLESGVVDYDALTAWSTRYARPEITIRRSAARSRKGDEQPDAGSPSALLMFDANLRPHRGEGSASNYLIMEDIPVGFHYWREERERAFSGDIITPPYVFKLVRCRGAR
jgi:hypothetical protein